MAGPELREKELLINKLLVRIHFSIVIRWIGFALWASVFPFPGSLTSTFLMCREGALLANEDTHRPRVLQ